MFKLVFCMFPNCVFEPAYFIKFLIVCVAVQRTRQCKQTAKNRPNLEINKFSENGLQTSFIFDYLTFLRALSNCMHVDLQLQSWTKLLIKLVENLGIFVQ